MILIVTLSGLFEALRGNPTSSIAERIVVHHAVGYNFFLPLAHLQKIAEVESVATVTPALGFGGIYKDDQPRNTFGQLSVDPDAWPLIFYDYHIDPSELRQWQSNRNAFIAGRELVRRYGWRLDDHIRIMGSYMPITLDLVLKGIYTGVDESNIYFHHQYLANSWQGGGLSYTSMYIVRTNMSATVARVCNQINQLFENSSFPVRAMPESEYAVEFSETLGNVDRLSRAIIGASLLTMMLIVANSAIMSTRKRYANYAVMWAIGFGRGEIAMLIASEAFLTGIISGAIGAAMARPCLRGLLFFMEHSDYALYAYNVRVRFAQVLNAFTATVSITTLAGCFCIVELWRTNLMAKLRR